MTYFMNTIKSSWSKEIQLNQYQILVCVSLIISKEWKCDLNIVDIKYNYTIIINSITTAFVACTSAGDLKVFWFCWLYLCFSLTHITPFLAPIYPSFSQERLFPFQCMASSEFHSESSSLFQLHPSRKPSKNDSFYANFSDSPASFQSSVSPLSIWHQHPLRSPAEEHNFFAFRECDSKSECLLTTCPYRID